MLLHITRSQDISPTGTVFRLTCRLELAPDEQTMLTVYGAPPLQEVLNPIEPQALVDASHDDDYTTVADAKQREDRLRSACNGTIDYWSSIAAWQGTDTY